MTINANINWQRNREENFLRGRYGRTHQWQFDGGATFPVSSSPQVVPVPMSDPALMDPEEAFVAAVASCHLLFFLAMAAKKRLVVEHYQDDPMAEMEMVDGKTSIRQITLRPAIVFENEQVSSDDLQLLHDQAHEQCYLANSILAEIIIKPITV